MRQKAEVKILFDKYEALSKILNISKDRYEFITSYIAQIGKDYKGNILDMIKDITYNFKENEKYFALYMIVNFSSDTFQELSDIQQEEHIRAINKILKIGPERIPSLLKNVSDILIESVKDNLSEIDTIKRLTYANIIDNEKSYVFILFGLMT